MNINQRCGSVLNWKRVQGTNGKLQAFGFCEYDNPESTLRCIRLLNGYEIGEKKLLVKVDQQTKELQSEHLKKRRSDALKTKNAKKAAIMRNIPNKKAGDGTEADDNDDDESKYLNLELVDEYTLKEDRVVIGALESIKKQYHEDLNPEPVVVAPTTTETTTNTPDATATAATTATPTSSTTNETSNNGASTKTVKIFYYFNQPSLSHDY